MYAETPKTEHSKSSSRDVLTLIQTLLQAPVPLSVALGSAGSKAGYQIENKGLFLLGYEANFKGEKKKPREKKNFRSNQN